MNRLSIFALTCLFAGFMPANVYAQSTFKPAQQAEEKAKKSPRKTTPEDATKRKSDKIANPVAVFDGLDKITARITNFDAAIDKTVTFGALKVTPRVCYTRPYSDQPQTSAFVEVDETDLDGQVKRIFTGWMFADSPGLNAVEHPVFDVWLKNCRGGKQSEIKEGPKTGYDGDGPQLKDENAETPAEVPAAPPAAPKPKSSR